ncbi:MAG: acyltransferase [Bacteroidetes bacterium]|nr:MAG: acyltransferase [Bacteroidota bacterium]
MNGENNSVVFNKSIAVYNGLKILIEGNDCMLSIGDGTTIGQAVIQFGESNTRVEIGTDSMLSRNIRINTSDFHSIIDLGNGQRINPPQNVIIGNHCWVGNGVYINKGALIGDNSVIAASSVITKGSFDNNSIIAGIPGKVVKRNITWVREKL